MSSDWLADAQGTARRLTAEFGLPAYDETIYGGHCVNCEAAWALPADKATCPHLPICEDCWPNGCPACEAKLEGELRHRETAVNAITSAAAAMIEHCDSLTVTDLKLLDWRTRGDLLKQLAQASEAMLRVADTLNAHGRAVSP